MDNKKYSQTGRFAVFFLLSLPFLTYADANEDIGAGEIKLPKQEPRTYITREDRRNAGVKHKITDWLNVAGLFEAEYFGQKFKLRNRPKQGHADEISGTFQFVAELSPWKWLKSEVIYEYARDSGQNPRGAHGFDEVILGFEYADFELELGKLFVPFGLYFSHFVVGPLLEFGETRAERGANLSFGPSDSFDFSTFVYLGKADPLTENNDLDWGLAVEIAPLDFLTFGASYLSDLADSDGFFLEDQDNRFLRRIDAISAYTVLGLHEFEITAEFVAALDRFAELDADRDRPRAWNMELAWYPGNAFEWAARIEGSDEFRDAPQLQGGLAVIWGVTPTVFLALDYLYGSYKRGFTKDNDGNAIRSSQQIAGQISIEF